MRTAKIPNGKRKEENDMKKTFALLLALVLALSCLTACGSASSAPAATAAPTVAPTAAPAPTEAAPADSDLAFIQGKGTMVVGITDYEPMDFKDENGNWTGFDAELAQMVCEELGVKCEFFVLADWGKKFFELETKNIDCIWNGMTITDEVKLNTNCSDPYVINAQVLVMKADVVGQYDAVELLQGLTFAVENGSAGQDEVVALGVPDSQIIAAQDQAAALMEVAAGTSDACVIDITMANAMTGEGTSYADLASGISLSSEEYGIGFRKDSDVTAKVNELLAKYKADGTLQALADKYNLTLA